jgi:hypothetical protein
VPPSRHHGRCRLSGPTDGYKASWVGLHSTLGAEVDAALALGELRQGGAHKKISEIEARQPEPAGSASFVRGCPSAVSEQAQSKTYLGWSSCGSSSSRWRRRKQWRCGSALFGLAQAWHFVCSVWLATRGWPCRCQRGGWRLGSPSNRKPRTADSSALRPFLARPINAGCRVFARPQPWFESGGGLGHAGVDSQIFQPRGLPGDGLGCGECLNTVGSCSHVAPTLHSRRCRLRPPLGLSREVWRVCA